MKKLTLALDIGNVCIRINPFNCIQALRLAAPSKELLDAEIRFECGKTDEEQFFQEIRATLPNCPDRETLRNAFNSILIEPVSGMNELVSAFPSRGVNAIFFSDISSIHLARTRELFPAAASVGAGVFSYEVGAMKPSAAMFENFERRFGAPDLYVDDRLDLIDAAARHGWNAMVFAGAKSLDDALSRLTNF